MVLNQLALYLGNLRDGQLYKMKTKLQQKKMIFCYINILWAHKLSTLTSNKINQHYFIWFASFTDHRLVHFMVLVFLDFIIYILERKGLFQNPNLPQSILYAFHGISTLFNLLFKLLHLSIHRIVPEMILFKEGCYMHGTFINYTS